MTFSVNTNGAALTALQNLNLTNSQMNTVQARINTGMRVATAKDNAAVFNIAQGLRADVSGLNSVKASIDRAISTIDVAIAAGEAVSDLLIEMKEKAVAAKDTGLDDSSRTALNDEFKELRSQITTIVENAEFNGVNAVQGDAVSAILNADGGNSLTIPAQGLTLGSTIISVTGSDNIAAATSAVKTVTNISASLKNLGSALSKLGSGAKRLELQKNFVNKLSDSIEVGIGNLVDADLAKESANLQAMQVKQQLGLQALGIANQAPNAVLSLFG